MKIIDAHLHLFPEEESYGDLKAEEVGHENSVEHLRQVYEELDILQGVVMTNRSLALDAHDFPSDLFHYCIGLDTFVMRGGLTREKLALVEEHLCQPSCCGVKLYPGYTKIWLTDPQYTPVYELAQKYSKTVAVHTGLTSHPRAHLKYSHPLQMDEVAADFRKVRFVMCHFGYPFFQDAATVLAKNPNVYGDLSGLVEGGIEVEEYYQEYQGIFNQMTQWMHYVNAWDKLLFGTDFPIVNYREYISFICKIVPEKQWEKVFFRNANYVYKLGLK